MLGQGTKLVTLFIFVFASLHVNNGQDNHPPTFSKSSSPYYAEIAENNDIGTIVLQVTAMDVDVNDTLSYKLHTGTDDFTIDGNGTITAKIIFDREVTSSYQITVEVTDGMSWPFIVQALVHVQIIDQNDNRPEFKNMPYEVTMSENTGTGQKVLTTVATDADIGTNSRVQYRIISGDKDGLFSVSHYWGVLTLEKSLDYESMPNDYALTVEAFDWGTPSLSSHANIVIHIKDADDQGPEFSQSLYWKEIKEDVAIGSSVLTVSAFDKDKGTGQNHAVAYSILSGNDGNAFTINASTGELKVNSLLDMEALGRYTLILEASELDSNQSPVNARIVIIVLDVNDNPPAFQSKNYSASLLENAQIGANVIQVIAEDNDMDVANRKIRYGFKQSDSKRPFSIDSVSGVITLNSQVDYESGITSHTFQVTATNLAAPSASDTTTVVVNIVDINDNKPVFHKRVFEGHQNENTATDTVIVQVLASDADSNSFCQLTYSFVYGNADGRFEINRTTGKIRNKLILDREQQDLYTLTVQAEDCGTHSRSALLPPVSSRLSGIAQVKITITDENDNAPAFAHPYALKVGEGSIVGEMVGCVSASDPDDPDVNGNGLATYSLTGNDVDDFAIGNISGEISVSRPLDYEARSEYHLTVVATDGGGRKGNTSLAITVIDINDNPPEFSQTNYSATLDENVPLGFRVLQVSASEKDTTRVITYSLSGGDGHFRMVPTTGEVQTAKSIDFEEARQYTFHVTAKDNGTPPRQSSVPVSVAVQDMNDNEPQFTQSTYSATVQEELPDGQSIAKVFAIDKDSSSNGAVSYAIVDGIGKDRFVINSTTGDVATTTPLDRENQTSYRLTLQARDSGSPCRVANATLTVIVQDVNDNAPYFDPSSYATVSLSEDTAIGTTILTVTARDNDIGVNQKILYSLSGDGGRFRMNRTTGELTTAASLNREIKMDYALRITASDSGLQSRSVTLNVDVTVTDVNDNAPDFTQSSYSGVILEGAAKGSFILTVSATDSDHGDNGVVVYSIVGGNEGGEFRVTASGEVQATTIKLDRETKSSYTMTVQATDKGSPPKSTTVLLQVTVTDANDNNPVFTARTYGSTINEQAVIGTTLLFVTATDRDTGLNGAFRYSFANPDSVIVKSFSIDPSSGHITTTKSLNAEKMKQYTFEVRATDKGVPSLSSYAKVVIQVSDVNDNDPVFNETKYRPEVYENEPSGTWVATVLATEKDANDSGKVTYTISYGDASEKFQIDPISGEITTRDSLDRESVPFYTLTVTATDNGIPPRSGQTMVEVIVLDRNDQSPKCEFNLYTKTIAEGTAAIGTVAAIVSASDGDLGPNRNIKYSITGGNSDGIFSIADPSVGNVTTVKAMDREATPNIPAYTLTITATDQGPGRLTGTTKVQISISDINDNSPQFIDSPYSAAIAESLPGGSCVLQVNATDIDMGKNAEIVYKLVAATPATGLIHFDLDDDSGLLRIKPVSLDFETLKSYRFEVSASDNGSPALTATTTISVLIIDVNDNIPVFPDQPYNQTLAEGETSFCVTIVRVSAIDVDSGLYGTVRYSITSGNAAGHFAIDPSTGLVTTTQSLDFESKRSYELTVTAHDQNGTGDPLTRHSASTMVLITLTDINDNAPEFDSASYVEDVSESGLIGVEVVTLTANDDDSGSNAAVVYNITKGNTGCDFTIDPVTGKITVAKSLDIERTIHYDLEVVAKDKGTPSLYATVTVRIDVVDTNDHTTHTSSALTTSVGQALLCFTVLLGTSFG